MVLIVLCVLSHLILTAFLWNTGIFIIPIWQALKLELRKIKLIVQAHYWEVTESGLETMLIPEPMLLTTV